MTEFVFNGANRLFPKNAYLSLFLGFLFSFSSCSLLYAQLRITSPVNHQIVQRDQSGFADIPVTGYAYFPYATIEAYLIPLGSGKQETKQISFGKDQLRQGFLRTSFQAETGWYQLQLIGSLENGNRDTATIARVGVGEIFLVAGNSNAMGLPDLGSRNSSDNVISMNAVNKFLNSDIITVAPDEPMPGPVFSPIRANHYIFPSGETSWYWGELGDMLNKKFNTPVLFFNAAWAAANAENYGDGASGKDAFNVYVGKFWPNRQPYTNIVNTVRYMNSSLGLRAVLWSHGENDAQQGVKEDAYFTNIRTLIANSRLDSGRDIPWIIARNSVSSAIPKPHMPIITAQNRLIALKSFNTYAGPDLDTIQMPRPAQGHFENITGGVQGLTLAASAWNRVLTDSLLKRITPVQPGYAVHTGVVPSKVFPGGSFTLPYHITGVTSGNFALQAELLDSTGKFAGIAGSGNENPLKIKIPEDLKNGQYRLRLTGTNPILTGSISDPFSVSNAYRKIDFVQEMTARKIGEETYFSWLTAAVSGLKKITVQENAGGESFSDLKSFDISDNEVHSQLYAHVVKNNTKISTYYRLKLEYKNGQVAYAGGASIFGENSPAAFVVFPNPVTRQQFYLRSDADLTRLRCTLFDARGSEHPIVVNDDIPGLIQVQPVYHLPSSKYILRITTESGVITRNVMFY